MKKNMIFAILVLSCFFSFSAIAHADDAAEKLGRGAMNIISSPIELARTINIQSRVKGAGYGWTMGLVEGIGRTFLRFGAGVIEVVTFPFDFPKDDKSALLTPDYPWQKWDVEYL